MPLVKRTLHFFRVIRTQYRPAGARAELRYSARLIDPGCGVLDFLDNFPTPPPPSPSTRSTLGAALALNTLMAAGVHLGMSFAAGFPSAEDDLTPLLTGAAPAIYLALLLPIVALYGIAAAAWTGWSWWRVPIATLAGATAALGLNAWAMAHWIGMQGWKVNPLLSAQDGRVDRLLGLALLSVFVLGLVAASLWPRWTRPAPPLPPA